MEPQIELIDSSNYHKTIYTSIFYTLKSYLKLLDLKIIIKILLYILLLKLSIRYGVS